MDEQPKNLKVNNENAVVLAHLKFKLGDEHSVITKSNESNSTTPSSYKSEGHNTTSIDTHKKQDTALSNKDSTKELDPPNDDVIIEETSFTEKQKKIV